MKPIFSISGLGLAIVQKELNLRFRRFRSLIVQLVFAAVLGGSMWLASFGSGISRGPWVSPEDHAQWLVTVYFAVQLAALFLVIPAIGAVSITTERLGRTWDLLIGTDLSPGEIVRGKLLSLLGITFYFMFLPAPILALTSLFGGVSIGSILFEYFIQMLVALLLGSCALLSSTAAKGTARAILQILPLAAFGLSMSLGFLTSEVYSDGMLILDYLLLNQPPMEFWIITIPIYLFTVISTLMGATYFLSGAESAREIPIRILTVIMFLTAVSLYIFEMAPLMTNSRTISLTRGHGEFLLVVLGFVPLILLRLAGAPSRVPLRVAQIYQEGNPISRAGYLLLPGGFRNLIFAVAVFCLPFVGLWILRESELSGLSQVSPNFDMESYNLRMDHHLQLVLTMFLWGLSLLSLCWFYAQVGFGSIVSSVLGIGTHVALLMFVVTMSVMTAGGPSSEVAGAYLSPLWTVGFSTWNEESGRVLLIKSNWFSTISVFVLVVGGMVISRSKGLPVFKVQRPGMDRLYLELPEEVS